MKLKTKLLAGAGSLVMAGSMMAAVAPAAHAAVTTVGQCAGSIGFTKITGPTKGVGLTDQTQIGVKTAGNLSVDLTTHLKYSPGNCSGVTRPGDTHVPNNNPLTTLTPVSQASALLGNASCANGATAQAADATAANAYPLNGKITWTFSQHYTDLITLASVPYKMQADVELLGFDPSKLDVVNLGGIVLSGVNVGALLETAQTGFASSIWENPATKAATGTPPASTTFNSGYNADLAPALGCADGTPNNANILQVFTGDTTPSPLLGSTANGLIFEFGQP